MACFLNFFSWFSLVIVSVQIYRKVFPWLYQNIVGPLILGPKIKFADYGEWALITGATEGIGKAYANHLAKAGLNVCLVSRSKAKLDAVAQDIVSKYNVQTKTVVVDFSHGPEIYSRIGNEINGLSIGVLVNNVGVSYLNPELFLEVPDRDKTFTDILTCNITSVVEMTKLLLPRMVANQRGIILNIASMAGTIPSPMLTVYSASKAFVDKFSEDLHTEYGDQGILVQSVLPGFVATNMTKLRRTSVMAPSADTYVAAAMRTIGYARHTTGYLPHALMQLLIQTLYSVAPDFTNSFTLKQMKDIKRKAVKLIEKAKAKAN